MKIETVVRDIESRARAKLKKDFIAHSPEEWFSTVYPPFSSARTLVLYYYQGDYVGASVYGFAEQMTCTLIHDEISIQFTGHDRHRLCFSTRDFKQIVWRYGKRGWIRDS